MTPNGGDVNEANMNGGDQRSPQERVQHMWNTKLGESQSGSQEGLHESIAKSGVQTPVGIQHDNNGNMSISDGHHRIAAANNINPNMEIPITNNVPNNKPNPNAGDF